MSDTLTLGTYLRRERERRGLTLRSISDSTKVSLPLFEGLEADDVSKWPGGIFRRAFVRAYAQCVGLDSDDVVRRFEEQHKPTEDILLPGAPAAAAAGPSQAPSTQAPKSNQSYTIAATSGPAMPSKRARVQGTAADLTVAAILAFASAAAGSRLLWPVLLIAAYYAIGVLLTGTSPMVALLADQQPQPAVPKPATNQPETAEAQAARSEGSRRHQRRVERRHRRNNVHARAN
jgi:helix-turn-helix protein